MSIAAISGVIPANLVPAVESAGRSGGVGDFGEMLGKALDTVSSSQLKADNFAVQAATGDLAAIHDFTVAATEAQILTQLTVEVRNRAVEAFNDIMRMQV